MQVANLDFVRDFLKSVSNELARDRTRDIDSTSPLSLGMAYRRAAEQLYYAAESYAQALDEIAEADWVEIRDNRAERLILLLRHNFSCVAMLARQVNRVNPQLDLAVPVIPQSIEEEWKGSSIVHITDADGQSHLLRLDDPGEMSVLQEEVHKKMTEIRSFVTQLLEPTT